MDTDTFKQTTYTSEIEYAQAIQSVLNVIKTYPSILLLSKQELLFELESVYHDLLFKFDTVQPDSQVLLNYIDYVVFPLYEDTESAKNIQQLLFYLEKAIENNTDYDLNNRSLYRALAKVYYIKHDYAKAEENILKAYCDFDYSIESFSLLIRILDAQKQYDKILAFVKEYVSQFGRLHRKLTLNDLSLQNILATPMRKQLILLLEE